MVLRARLAACVLTPDEVNDLWPTSIAAGAAPYKSGRAALRSRLVGLVRQQLRAAGSMEADEPWLERELTSSEAFQGLIDHLWPSVSPEAMVRELLSRGERLERCGCGSPDRRRSASSWSGEREQQGRGTAAWTADDLPLLDEATFLINGRTASYGHIVVDEAQDLSPMQFRMMARRAPTGSLTILGDLAQATGAWSYQAWDEILAPSADRSAPPAWTS